MINVATGKVVGVSEATYDAEASESLNLTVSIDHACKIISLIESGRTPSPPTLPIMFMEYDIDYPQLVVAKSYYPDKSLLRIGDVITHISGSQKAITNIDQLIFQLRGVRGSVDLVVDRSGQQVIVTLPIVPHPKILERKGLTVSGMTLTNYDPIDRSGDGFDNMGVVVYVAEESSASNSIFDVWDTIYSIDGSRVFNIDDIYQALLPFNNEDVEVNVVVRWMSSEFNKVYKYSALALEVRDMKFLVQ